MFFTETKAFVTEVPHYFKGWMSAEMRIYLWGANSLLIQGISQRD